MKKILTIILLLQFGFYGYTQVLKNLNPTNIEPVEIDQDLIDNFNTEESYKKCGEVWDKMDEENRGWKDLTEQERHILKYCGEVRQNVWEIVGGGCSWYCGSGLGSQTASSYLKSQGTNSYKPSNTHDLSYETAWVEGVDGYGIGEYIEYEFPPSNPRINTVIIVNGYVKSQSTWINNSRVKRLKMYVNGKPYAFLSLEDKRAAQTFSVDPIGHSDRKDFKALETKSTWQIKFEIVDVYKGNKYDDVAITEIYFDGLDVHCFAAGTKITLADKSEVNIEELMIKQEVLSLNSSTGQFEPSKILELASPTHHNLIEITFSNGQTITATQDHPFFDGQGWLSFAPDKTQADYNFEKVSQLHIGVKLQTIEGDLEIISVKRIPESQRTYTIVRMSRNESFIANGVVVGTEELRVPTGDVAFTSK